MKPIQIAAGCVCVLALADTAVADCNRPRSALTALEYSDVVFRGVVRDVKTTGGLIDGSTWPWTGWIVTFEVTRVWKGAVGSRFVLYSMRGAPDDAFTEFERGAEYLVFARRNSEATTARFQLGLPTTYGAHACGGTSSILSATKYLLDLGVGRSPAIAVRNPRPSAVHKIHDVHPVWPEAAQRANIRGTVLVEFTITIDGNVTDARILRGVPLLDEAALECVRQWRYEPVLLNGRPVPIVTTAAVAFP